jgi:hypothetical protein
MTKTDPDRPMGPITAVPEKDTIRQPKAGEWYDLERYSSYRDLLAVAGFVLIVAGLAQISGPAAIMLLGTGLIAAAYLMARSI